MIGKIKGIIEVEKKINDVLDTCEKHKDESKKHAQSLKTISQSVKEMQKQMQDFGSHISDVTKELKSDMGQLQSIKQELHNELNDFRLFKTTLKKKLAEELAHDFRAELGKHAEKLKTDVHSYNELKKQIDTIGRTLTATHDDIKKFTNISKNIKESDFQLTGYIKKITALDREKLSLMKKVEDLQRLVGKERRNKSRNQSRVLGTRY